MPGWPGQDNGATPPDSARHQDCAGQSWHQARAGQNTHSGFTASLQSVIRDCPTNRLTLAWLQKQAWYHDAHCSGFLVTCHMPW